MFGSYPPIEKGIYRKWTLFFFPTGTFPSQFERLIRGENDENLSSTLWNPKGATTGDSRFSRFFWRLGQIRLLGEWHRTNLLEKKIGMFFFDAKTTSFCLKLIESVTWVNWTPPKNARQCLLDDSFEVTSSDGVPPNRIPGFLHMRSPTPKPLPLLRKKKRNIDRHSQKES